MTTAQKRAAILAVLLLALTAAGCALAAIWTRDDRWAETAVVFGVMAAVVAGGTWLAEL